MTDERSRARARARRPACSGRTRPSTTGARAQRGRARSCARRSGQAGLARSVVSRDLPPFEQVNVQVALDAWAPSPGARSSVHGVAVPPHHGSVSLQQLLHGDGLPPLRLSRPRPRRPAVRARPHGRLPARGPCCSSTDARGAYVLHLRGPEPHEEPTIALEVAGLATDAAQEVLRELDELRSALNVYRGQVLELRAGRRGGLEVVFPVLPRTVREDVVLPEAVLRRVERHTVDIAERRQALRDAGQHLKRGLLLHGPPGTGKTHTTRYVVQRLAGSTVVMLSGQALQMIGARDGAGPRAAARGRRARGRRPRRRGPRLRARAEPGAVRAAGRDGRRGGRRRPAVPADHQPGRPARAGAGRAAGARRRGRRGRPARRRRAPPAVRGLQPRRAARGRRGADGRGRGADRRRDRVVRQGAAAPGGARGAVGAGRAAAGGDGRAPVGGAGRPAGQHAVGDAGAAGRRRVRGQARAGRAAGRRGTGPPGSRSRGWRRACRTAGTATR